MNFEIVMPVLISFAISVLLSPILIPFLKKLRVSQFIRDDGPQTHLKKMGTPTMGGIIILISVVTTSLLYIKECRELIPVLFLTLGFGIIGLLDDFIKIVMMRSMGLHAWQKLLAQILITSIFGYYLLHTLNYGTQTLLPFHGGAYFDLGKWFLPILFIAVIGTVNGVNFTDGLDGLASSVTVMVATFFSVVAIGIGSGISPITCAVAGSLLGFLIYNVYPARVFMGDTGSLALGGFVAASAYMLRMPFFIIIIGFIYLLEVLSVMIQVIYFNLSGGKRIFKMAPIHHHLELCGWTETRIVAAFSIITALLCLIGFVAL
ncbi:MAG: phospho-N-acetylmuramoyl-pentapeptide-transferase [Velocimicrobium sp.]